jgi:hypothetical protein
MNLRPELYFCVKWNVKVTCDRITISLWMKPGTVPRLIKAPEATLVGVTGFSLGSWLQTLGLTIIRQSLSQASFLHGQSFSQASFLQHLGQNKTFRRSNRFCVMATWSPITLLSQQKSEWRTDQVEFLIMLCYIDCKTWQAHANSYPALSWRWSKVSGDGSASAAPGSTTVTGFYPNARHVSSKPFKIH